MKSSYRILCVCMGNVCRSPTAEAVLRQLLREAHLADRVEVGSAGTHGYWSGALSDARTQLEAAERGYDVSAIRARKIGWHDLEHFDLILAMDRSNLQCLRRMATPEQLPKIRLFMSFAGRHELSEVPDPMVTLGVGFGRMLDLIEAGARGLVKALKSGQLAAESGDLQ